MMPGVTTNTSQSDMQSRSMAGLEPIKTRSVPLKIPRPTVHSAREDQQDPLTGNHISNHCVCLILTGIYTAFIILQMLPINQTKSMSTQLRVQMELH